MSLLRIEPAAVNANSSFSFAGGGGGGPGNNGGTGGSGVVIIAYPSNYLPLSSIGGGLSYDQPSRSGYRVYRFYSGTGTISW